MIVPLLMITDHERKAVERIERFMSGFSFPEGLLTVDQVWESSHVFIGSLKAILEKFHRNRERFGVSHFVFFEPLDVSMEIVKNLAGF